MTEPRDRFQRVEAVFVQAQRLPAASRRAFVEERTGDDLALRDEVLALLAEDALTSGALDHPPLGAADLAKITETAATSPLPTRIGRYRILGLLGEGGMGAVYEAEQDEPRRRVALKVIRSGGVSPSALQRFKREAHTLAQLSHHGIARIYDAGAEKTSFGEAPYFAMELIEGKPLVEHACAQSLSTRDRLELLIEIAEALQHAHDHGVIHRDLKPANILVEATGRPRILDFGVSRIVRDGGEDATLRTESGVLLGTLAYMSPEQASGDASQADARSDVYSLGVIAYELLSGQLPYEIRRGAIHEAARIINHSEPTSLGASDRTLRGDIEIIVNKALGKSPSRRYQSAREFADDIRRHLDNKPILARPPSAGYQFTRFARRNRPLVAGVAAAFVVLLISLAVISALLLRTMRAETRAVADRDEAARQTEIAQAVNEFLVNDLIAAVSPDVTEDREVTLLDLLDAAAERIEGRLANAPDAEAQLRRTIASTYWDLHEPAKALPHGTRALELARQLYGPTDHRTLQALSILGDIKRQAGMFDEAAAAYQEFLDASEATPDIDPSALVMSLHNLGSLRRVQGRFDEALELLERAHQVALERLTPESNAYGQALAGLAGIHRYAGRYPEAARLYEELLDTQVRDGAFGTPDLARTTGSLALVYSSMRRFDESAQRFLQAIEMSRRVLGEEHVDTILMRTNLGLLYIRMERIDAAAEHLRSVHADAIAALGESHPTTLLAGFQLGKALTMLGRAESSYPLLTEVHTASVTKFGEAHPQTVVTLNELIRAACLVGQVQQAERLSEQLLEHAAKGWAPDHEFFGYFLETRGKALASVGRTADALDAYIAACAIFENTDPENPALETMRTEIERLRTLPVGE